MHVCALSPCQTHAECVHKKERPRGAGVFSAALAGGVSNVSFSQLSANLGQTMYQFKFRIPAYYTLLVRSLSVLEARPLPAAAPFAASALRGHTRTCLVASRIPSLLLATMLHQ